MSPNLHLPYILCFCLAGESVLMLHRKKQPNQGLWNGIGGKIDNGETPEQTLARETLEETGIHLDQARSITYGGIVSWYHLDDPANRHKGMYVYLVRLPESFIQAPQETREGRLEWRPSSWVCDLKNRDVVNNIPHFLPLMLNDASPQHHHFTYQEMEIQRIEIRNIGD